MPPQPAESRPRPAGWPVGSFSTYDKAQAAVDMLSDKQFDVSNITIVGLDLMEVERVTGRLTWPRVILNGIASGSWLGLFFGLLLGIMDGTNWLGSIILGVGMGIVFSVVTASVSYAMQGGRRDSSSATHIVAGSYDVLCDPLSAPQARDLISEFIAAGH